jgi:hypothetical protein
MTLELKELEEMRTAWEKVKTRNKQELEMAEIILEALNDKILEGK